LPDQDERGMPIPIWQGRDDAEDVPILQEIPRERWSEVLRPRPRWVRKRAVGRLTTGADVEAGMICIGYLDAEAPPPPNVPVPSAPGAPAAGPAKRAQVNFRLAEDQHARLCQAAAMFGLAPTQFARLLVMRGVDEALRSPGSG
jgi:hypothetical protein